MTIINSMASFKNSRISSRKPTTEANTYQINVGTGANTLVAPANANRTYITLRNLSTTNDAYYDYFDNPFMLTEGFFMKAGDCVDLDSPEDIFMRAVGAIVAINVDEGEG